MSKESFSTTEAIQASLKKRYAREKRFQWYGRLAVLTGFVFLFILLADIVGKGTPSALAQTRHPAKKNFVAPITLELSRQVYGRCFPR